MIIRSLLLAVALASPKKWVPAAVQNFPCKVQLQWSWTEPNSKSQKAVDTPMTNCNWQMQGDEVVVGQFDFSASTSESSIAGSSWKVTKVEKLPRDPWKSVYEPVIYVFTTQFTMAGQTQELQFKSQVTETDKGYTTQLVANDIQLPEGGLKVEGQKVVPRVNLSLLLHANKNP